MNGSNIIEKIKSGDDEILQYIYHEYKSSFCAFLRKIHDIELDQCIELFQISVVVLYDNVATGRLTELTGGLKSYLFGIGKVKAREYFRKQAPVAVNWDENLTHTILDLDGVEDKKELEECLNKVLASFGELSAQCQKLLDLFYFQKSRLTEISQEMSYKNVNTTKNLKYKCLKKLRKIYEEASISGQSQWLEA